MTFFDDATDVLGDFFYSVYDFFANTIPKVFNDAIEGIRGFLEMFDILSPVTKPEPIPNLRTDKESIDSLNNYLEETRNSLVRSQSSQSTPQSIFLDFSVFGNPNLTGGSVREELNNLLAERFLNSFERYGGGKGDSYNINTQNNNNTTVTESTNAEPLTDQGLFLYGSAYPFYVSNRAFGMQ